MFAAFGITDLEPNTAGQGMPLHIYQVADKYFMIPAEAGQLCCVTGIMQIAEQKNPAVLAEGIVQSAEKPAKSVRCPVG